jgi:hypothetical protein
MTALILLPSIVLRTSRDSSVGTVKATGWTTGVSFPAWPRDSSLLHSVQTGSEATQPPIQWVSGALSSGIKQLGREADHSPPHSADGALPRFSHTS